TVTGSKSQGIHSSLTDCRIPLQHPLVRFLQGKAGAGGQTVDREGGYCVVRVGGLHPEADRAAFMGDTIHDVLDHRRLGLIDQQATPVQGIAAGAAAVEDVDKVVEVDVVGGPLLG